MAKGLAWKAAKAAHELRQSELAKDLGERAKEFGESETRILGGFLLKTCILRWIFC